MEVVPGIVVVTALLLVVAAGPIDVPFGAVDLCLASHYDRFACFPNFFVSVKSNPGKVCKTTVFNLSSDSFPDNSKNGHDRIVIF